MIFHCLLLLIGSISFIMNTFWKPLILIILALPVVALQAVGDNCLTNVFEIIVIDHQG